MAIKLGIAPCTWGVWFGEDARQMPWQRCLDEMQAAGYKGLELGPWGYLPNTHPELADELTKRDLKLVAAMLEGNPLDKEDGARMLRTVDDMAALLSHHEEARLVTILPPMYSDLVTGEIVINPVLTDEEWHRLCDNVQKCADRFKTYGIEAVFHPHGDTHVMTEAEIERFLDETDVNLVFDTGHHVYGGGDPVSFYKKHADRIHYIHIKDCDLAVKQKKEENGWSFAKAVIEGIMVAPGEGSVDYVAFREALEEKGFDGWCVVEHDQYPLSDFDDALPAAKRGLDNLLKMGYVIGK